MRVRHRFELQARGRAVLRDAGVQAREVAAELLPDAGGFGHFEKSDERGPVENAQNRIDYFERMLGGNPKNPTGLPALANEYKKAGRNEDEAAVLKRYVGAHERERFERQRAPRFSFRACLTGDGAGAIELSVA